MDFARQQRDPTRHLIGISVRHSGARDSDLCAGDRTCAQGRGGDQEAADGDDHRGNQAPAAAAAAAEENRNSQGAAAARAALYSAARHSAAGDAVGTGDRRAEHHAAPGTVRDHAAAATGAAAAGAQAGDTPRHHAALSRRAGLPARGHPRPSGQRQGPGATGRRRKRLGHGQCTLSNPNRPAYSIAK